MSGSRALLTRPLAWLGTIGTAVALDVWEGEADALSECAILACTAPFRPPAPQQPCKQTAALVATRAMCDEELLMNYNLNPQGPLEAWYSPPAPSGL